MAEENDNQELAELCHYCLYWNFKAARQIISEKAKITPDEQKQILTGKTGDYILSHRADPVLHKMVKIEKIFYQSSLVLNPKVSTNENDALYAMSQLDEVMPYVFPTEQGYAKAVQARCCRYADVDDEKRYNIYKDVISSYPMNGEKTDEVFLFWAKEINDLSVPSVDKYQAIKTAQRKSSDYGKEAYREMLAPLADIYYEHMLRSAENSEDSYENRLQYFDLALKAVPDLDIPEQWRQKCSAIPGKITAERAWARHKRKLVVYSKMKKLYKENNKSSEFAALGRYVRFMCNDFYTQYPQYRHVGGSGGNGK